MIIIARSVAEAIMSKYIGKEITIVLPSYDGKVYRFCRLVAAHDSNYVIKILHIIKTVG